MASRPRRRPARRRTPGLQDYARDAAEHAYPDRAAAHTDLETATQNLRDASAAVGDVFSRFGRSRYQFGNLVNHPDPVALLALADQALPAYRSEHDKTHARVTELLTEPTLRVLPPERLATEKQQWRADRDADQRDAEHLAYQAALAAQEQLIGPRQHTWEPPTTSPKRGLSR